MNKSHTIHRYKFDQFKPWHLFALLIPSIAFTLLLLSFTPTNIVSYSYVSAEKEPEPETLQVKLGEKVITATKADTEERRTKGLSEHTILPKDNGMLFVFEKDNVHPVRFWMVGMDFPLDLIWIDDGKIVQIDENAQPQDENTPAYDVKFYLSYQPIDFVLEVNAGFVAENNLNINSPVEFITPQNNSI